jgi:hypothetical protein
VIKNAPIFDAVLLDHFTAEISRLRASGEWTKSDIVELFHTMLPDFGHKETGKYLDGRM